MSGRTAPGNCSTPAPSPSPTRGAPSLIPSLWPLSRVKDPRSARHRHPGRSCEIVPDAIALNNSALTHLPIDAPTYDRSKVSVGIAHIGAGHFHRAHQAAYINLLLQQGLAHQWGICGIGVMPADWTMRDVLDGQDGL